MPVTSAALLNDLPDVPELALLAMVKRVKQIQTAEGGLTSDETRIAALMLKHYAQQHDIDLKIAAGPPWSQTFNLMADEITVLGEPHVTEAVDRAIEDEVKRTLAASGKKVGIAVLAAGEKVLICEKIEAIRAIIEGSVLDRRKKNVLFGKLSKLQNEVMKNGTSTDALFAFMGEFGLHASEMATNARPALKEIKEIAEIVLDSRAKQEGLPKPYDLLSLTGPEEE